MPSQVISARQWIKKNINAYKNDKDLAIAGAKFLKQRLTSVQGKISLMKREGDFHSKATDKTNPTYLSKKLVIKGAISIDEYSAKVDVVAKVISVIENELAPHRQIVSDQNLQAHFSISEKQWRRVKDKIGDRYTKRLASGLFWGDKKQLEDTYNREQIIA